jgi:predicted transposase/invertase (TIGR01784 family)
MAAPAISPVNDLAFKKALGSNNHPEITLGFIQDFAGLTAAVGDVKIANPYDIQIASKYLAAKDAATRQRLVATLKDVTIDIGTADIVSEVQVKKENFFGARALYYACAQYTSRHTPDTGFRGLRPVHGINLVDFTLFRDTAVGLHCFRLADEIEQPTRELKWLRISFIELGKTLFPTPEQAAWCEFFRTGQAPAGAPAYIHEAAKIVDTANMDQEEREMIDLLDRYRADEREEFLTAQEDAREEGLAEGRATGLAEGRAEGRAEGLAEGEARREAQIIANAVARGESDEVIAQWTGLPVEAVARLRAAL